MASEASDQEDYSEEEGVYEGESNELGQYHGHGTLKFEKAGVTYIGEFVCGVKCGQGKMSFPDGCSMEGNWKDDAMHGSGKYVFEDGGKLVSSNWEEGLVQGEAEEYDDEGLLAFRGNYSDGVKSGLGEVFFSEGTTLQGHWEHGALSEKQVKFTLQDGSYYEGTWIDGTMTDALYFNVNGIQQGDDSYSEDISTKSIISSNPLLPDPYEWKYCRVAKSTTPNSGEGLFAKVDIPANMVCSFYNGIRITHPEVDGRDWALNSNTLSLDEDTVIDVPEEYNTTSVYCSSLAHKANHSLTPNAKYDTFFNHPRFGKIKCIRTTEPIAKDSEIFVDYGYELHEAPMWYILLHKPPVESSEPEPPAKKAKMSKSKE